MNQPKKEPRINTVSAVLMVCTALLCDLAGPIGAVGAVVIFFIWFKIKRVPILTTKKIGKQVANLGLNGIGEVASAGVWAGVTVGVILTIVFSRAEDAGLDLLKPENLKNPVGLVKQAASKVTSRNGAGSASNPTRDEITPAEGRVIRPTDDRWSQNVKPIAPKPNVDGLRKAA